MERIRWVGGRPVLPARILDEAIFEEWVRHAGSIAERRARVGLPLPFLFGRSRARRRLERDLRRALDAPPTLRGPLEAALAELPAIVATLATEIISHRLLVLVHTEAARRFVAVPREAVVRRIVRRAYERVGSWPSLGAYDGVCRAIVEAWARDAERVFVESARETIPAAVARRGSMIAAVDRDYAWGEAAPAGHYWLAETSMSTLDLDRREDRARFASTLERSIARARETLADLPATERTSLRVHLREVATGQGVSAPSARQRRPSGTMEAPHLLAISPNQVRSPGEPEAPKPGHRRSGS
ncbi:MAG: hypothetical protein R3B81_08240 [bacterium]